MKQPVPVEEVIAETSLVIEDVPRPHVPQYGDPDYTPVAQRGMDADGWRTCGWEPCSAHFKPDVDSRFFCSPDCATLSFYKRNGMASSPLMQRVTARVESGESDSEKDALKDERYGPLRDVERVLSETKQTRRGEMMTTGKRVVFAECGHEGSIAGRAQRGRCRMCLKVSRGEQPGDGRKKKRPVPPPTIEAEKESSHGRQKRTKQPRPVPVRRAKRGSRADRAPRRPAARGAKSGRRRRA